MVFSSSVVKENLVCIAETSDPIRYLYIIKMGSEI